MRSGRLRTACGFFLPCTTSRDANILDKAFRSTGKPFGPALSGQSASVRRRADGYVVADLRYRRPRATQGDAPYRANNARRYARTRNRREAPLSHDKRRRSESARRLHQISRSPASDGRRPLFSSAAPDRQTGASHRSRRSYRYTESDCCRISYPARHGPSPDKS